MKNLFEQIVSETISKSYGILGLDVIKEVNLNRLKKHGESGYVILSSNRSAISTPETIDDDLLSSDSNLLKQYIGNIPANEADLDSLAEKLNDEKAQEWLRRRNNEADEDLLKMIKSTGLSYSKVYGGYHGQDGVKDSLEPSYIVYNVDRNGNEQNISDLVKFARQMCRRYCQDSVYVKVPGEAPMYVDKDGNKVNSGGSDDMKFNREGEEFYTTTKRDKNSNSRFTSDIRFDEDSSDDRIFENMLYVKNLEYQDRLKRRQNGEIFI